MAESLALKTLLKVGDGATPTENFTTLLDVVELGAPGISVDTEELTSHSNADFWRKFGATLLDAGEITATVLWDPNDTGHQGVLTDLTGRIKRNFELEFPTTPAAVWSFSGYFTGFEPDPPTDEHLKAEITIKLTESISFA